MAKNNGELLDPVTSDPVMTKEKSSDKKKKKKRNIFKSIAKWFREMKSEIKKVVWPGPKDTAKMVLVSLVIIVASAIVIWGFDELAQFIVKAIISIGK